MSAENVVKVIKMAIENNNLIHHYNRNLQYC